MARGMSSSLSGYRPTSTPKQQHSGIAPLRIYGLTPFSACVLASPLLRTPPLSDRPSVRLPTGWLAFGRMGLDGFRYLTHWVTLTSFKSCQLYPLVPNLSRHNDQFVLDALMIAPLAIIVS